MTTQVESPIPTSVDVSVDADSIINTHNSNNSANKSSSSNSNSRNRNKNKKNSQYGATAATPENMATTSSQFSSPLGLFSGSNSSLLYNDENNNNNNNSNNKHDSGHNNGAVCGDHGRNQQDDSTEAAAAASIGIVTSNCENDDDDRPLSPLDLYLDKKKTSSPTPNLVEADDSESDGDNLWQLKLAQQQQQQQQDSPTASPTSVVGAATAPLPPVQPLHNDNVDRLVHKQTSEGHYLVNSRPLDSPMAGMKYSLIKGKKAMDPKQRLASCDRKSVKTHANVIVQPTDETAEKLSEKAQAAAAFKIFLLLMQPKSKIFEIIQVFYSPSQTTVRSVLDMIPANATEPALGSQHYIGLCRPKDGEPMGANALASTAKIIQGEILVAIPEHYSGSLCAKISKPILSNPKVTKLLNRSDPLAPKRKKKRRHRHHAVAIETVKEESESVDGQSVSSSPKPVTPKSVSPPMKELEVPEAVPEGTPVVPAPRKRMPLAPQTMGKNMKEERSNQEKDALRMALQHAAMEAASTNALVASSTNLNAISDTGSLASKEHDDCDIPVEMWKTTMSLRSRSTIRRSDSLGDSSTIASFGEQTTIASLDGNNSVDSLDTTEYQYKRMPRRVRRASTNSLAARRHRRKKQGRIFGVVVLAMVARYIMVGRQRIMAATETTEEEGVASFFSFWGVVQVCLAFFIFVKAQRYLEGRGEVQDCPFVQFVQKVWRRSQQQLNKSNSSRRR